MTSLAIRTAAWAACFLLVGCAKKAADQGAQLQNEDLAALAAKKPTARWSEALRAGDDSFTEAAIAEAEEILDKFLEDVDRIGRDPSRDMALPVLEGVVKAFNRLNETHGPVVESLEREELVEYFYAAFAAAGVAFSSTEDPSERWREW